MGNWPRSRVLAGTSSVSCPGQAALSFPHKGILKAVPTEAPSEVSAKPRCRQPSLMAGGVKASALRPGLHGAVPPLHPASRSLLLSRGHDHLLQSCSQRKAPPSL